MGKQYSKGIAEVPKHSFKRHEWRYIKSLKQLYALIRRFRLECKITVWTLGDIRHFLSVFHFLYPNKTPDYHHTRCIATIIRRLYP
jgi:hypothetical protein